MAPSRLLLVQLSTQVLILDPSEEVLRQMLVPTTIVSQGYLGTTEQWCLANNGACWLLLLLKPEF